MGAVKGVASGASLYRPVSGTAREAGGGRPIAAIAVNSRMSLKKALRPPHRQARMRLIASRILSMLLA